MKYENLEQAVSALKEKQQTMSAYHHAMGVLYLDATRQLPAIPGKAGAKPWRCCPKWYTT